MNTFLPNGQFLNQDGYNMGYSTTMWQSGSFLPPQPAIFPSYNQDLRDLKTWQGGWEMPKVDYWNSQSIYDYKMKTTY